MRWGLWSVQWEEEMKDALREYFLCLRMWRRRAMGGRDSRTIAGLPATPGEEVRSWYLSAIVTTSNVDLKRAPFLVVIYISLYKKNSVFGNNRDPCVCVCKKWAEQLKSRSFYSFSPSINIPALISRNRSIVGSSAVIFISWLQIFIANIASFWDTGIHLTKCVIRVFWEKRYADYLQARWCIVTWIFS